MFIGHTSRPHDSTGKHLLLHQERQQTKQKTECKSQETVHSDNTNDNPLLGEEKHES